MSTTIKHRQTIVLTSKNKKKLRKTARALGMSENAVVNLAIGNYEAV